MLDTQNSINNQQLAVLMTCHDRRDITLVCLQTLYQQDAIFDVFLLDDGSSDGTSEAVKQHYPNVKILPGNGNLFWGGRYADGICRSNAT